MGEVADSTLCRPLTNVLHPAPAERARDPDSITVKSLRNNIQKGNALFSSVKTPAEAVLDSNFLMVTSEMALHQARKLKVGGDYFDTDHFVGKLKMLVMGVPQRMKNPSQANAGRGRRVQVDDDDEEDELDGPSREPAMGWDIIGKLATRHTLRVPPIDFMYATSLYVTISYADIELLGSGLSLYLTRRRSRRKLERRTRR